jgi:hypothetical protein
MNTYGGRVFEEEREDVAASSKIAGIGKEGEVRSFYTKHTRVLNNWKSTDQNMIAK